jgi:hypothetical protein
MVKYGIVLFFILIGYLVQAQIAYSSSALFFQGAFTDKSSKTSLGDYLTTHDFFFRHQFDYRESNRLGIRFSLDFSESYHIQRFLIAYVFGIKEVDFRFFLTNRFFESRQFSSESMLGSNNLTASQIGINPSFERQRGRWRYGFDLSYGVGNSRAGIRRGILETGINTPQILTVKNYSVEMIQTLEFATKLEYRFATVDDLGIYIASTASLRNDFINYEVYTSRESVSSFLSSEKRSEQIDFLQGQIKISLILRGLIP